MNKRIVVNRSVYNVVQDLLKIPEATGFNVLSLAERKKDGCEASGDKVGERFWREVWLYMISAIYLDAELEIIEDRR